MTDIAESDSGELNLGHNGIGDGCVEKVINYSGKFFIAGGVFGSVEGCFLTPIPGSTRPMIFRCLGLMLNRSILFGTVGGVYAGSVCTVARLRDKDDYVNASIGGALVGSLFGIRHRSFSVGLGVAAGLSIVMGVVKYRTGKYLPSPYILPPPAPVVSEDSIQQDS